MLSVATTLFTTDVVGSEPSSKVRRFSSVRGSNGPRGSETSLYVVECEEVCDKEVAYDTAGEGGSRRVVVDVLNVRHIGCPNTPSLRPGATPT